MRYFLILVFSLMASMAQACGADSDCEVGDRSYRVSMSEDKGPVGALIWAHGYRGSAAGVMRNGSLRRMVHDQGLALIALQGVGDLWDLPNGPRTPDSTGAVEFDYIDAVIADAQVQFGIDTNELVASGFSAGGCWSGTSPARGLIPLQGSYPMQAPSGWSRSAIARHLSPVWFTFMGMRMALCR